MGRVHTDKSCLPVPLVHVYPRPHQPAARAQPSEHRQTMAQPRVPGLPRCLRPPPPSLAGVSLARGEPRRLRTGVTRLARWKRKTRLPEARVRIQPCLLSWPRSRSILIIRACYHYAVPCALRFCPHFGTLYLFRHSPAVHEPPPPRCIGTLARVRGAYTPSCSTFREAHRIFKRNTRRAGRADRNCCAPGLTAEVSRCITPRVPGA